MIEQEVLRQERSLPVGREFRCTRCNSVFAGVCEVHHERARGRDLLVSHDEWIQQEKETFEREVAAIVAAHIPNVRCPSCGRRPPGIASLAYNRKRGAKRGLLWGVAAWFAAPCVFAGLAAIPGFAALEARAVAGLGLPSATPLEVLGTLFGAPLVGLVLGALLNVHIFFRRDRVLAEPEWRELLAKHGNDPARVARTLIYEMQAGPRSGPKRAVKFRGPKKTTDDGAPPQP